VEARILRAKIRVGFVDDFEVLEAELEWDTDGNSAVGAAGVETIVWDDPSQTMPSEERQERKSRSWRLRIRTVVVMGVVGLAANLANLLIRH